MLSRTCVALLALSAACAVVGAGSGCSSMGTSESGTAALGASTSDGGDAGLGDDAAPPRRQCAAAKGDDGAWVTVQGLDTSDYEYTDWDAVVASNPAFGFAFARVSAGIVRVDTQFSHDFSEMKRVGLVRGAYQYFHPRTSAIAQADLMMQRLKDEGGLDDTDFPPVLDVETDNGMPVATVVCRVRLWLARVQRATGRVPMIYTSQSWGPTLAAANLRANPLWVANFVKDPTQTCPRMPDPWDTWQIWQYSESGTVGGVFANGTRDVPDAPGAIALDDAGAQVPAGTDLDYFNGTRDDLTAFVASTVTTTDVEDPPPPESPPTIVPKPLADGGTPAPIDCSDGCCVAGK